MSIKKRSTFKEIDLSKLKTFPMSELERKVQHGAFARSCNPGGSFSQFADSLPDILAAAELREFASIIANASLNEKAVIVMLGGHVVKTGLSPLLIDWMQKGVISALATHGAGVIHDTEIALFGRTSEDVAAGLADGSFGMCRDTADFINNTISDPANSELGYGEAIGNALLAINAPCADLSLLCSACRRGVPVCVHVGIGTDIIHQHGSADGGAIGRASLRDFRIFAAEVARLEEGSAVINIGSAVVMPEVFLKALTMARNLGFQAHGFAAANFDMFQHYRPTQNVLNRPTLTGGRKFNFTGHHEIMIPLLHALTAEKMSDS